MSKGVTQTEDSDEENDDIELGFWAIEVEPGKTFKQQLKQSILHITHASLGVSAKERNVLLNNNLPICVLTAGKDEHTSLDLRFAPGQEMKFSVSGSSSITVSGYYDIEFMHEDDEIDADGYIMNEADMDEDEDEDEDAENEITEGKKDVLVPMSKMAIRNESEDEDEETGKNQLIGNNKKRPAPNADKNLTPVNKKAKQEPSTPKNINTPTPNKQGGNKQQQQLGKGGDESVKKGDNKKDGAGNEKKRTTRK